MRRCERGLTIRSTGHFAAVQVWASFHSRPNPAYRKMPVSSNVRRRNTGRTSHRQTRQTFVHITKLHDTRCFKCKNTIYQMLRISYGEYQLKYKAEGVSTRIEDYRNLEIYETLLQIYQALVDYRGHDTFVKSKSLQRCDVYIPSKKLLIETDEYQHFSYPRYISLKNYPSSLSIGYNVSWYMNMCNKKRTVDNDPKYRDEQRAWYDTIRDFLPMFYSDISKTVRIPLGFHTWCSLDPMNNEHVAIFKLHALNLVE